MYKVELLKNNHVFQFVSQEGARTRDVQNSGSLNLNHGRLMLCVGQNRNMNLNV